MTPKNKRISCNRNYLPDFYTIFIVTIIVIILGFPFPAVSQTSNPHPKKIAVLDFEEQGNLSSFPNAAKIVADWIIEGLVQERRFNVIERRYLEQVLREQSLQHTGIVQDQGTVDVGRILGVAILVSGTVTGMGGRILVNARVVDVETGSILSAEGVQASSPEGLRAPLFAMVPYLIDGKPIEGQWDAWSESPSSSRVERLENGEAAWEYSVPVINDDTIAGIDLSVGSISVINRRIHVQIDSQTGNPLNFALYSFVEGFSSEKNDETLVPVVWYIEGRPGTLTLSISPEDMEIPLWWQVESGAKNIVFNPGDVRLIEFSAEVDRDVGPVSDRIRIHSVRLQ